MHMTACSQSWDARYRSEPYPSGVEPTAFLEEVLPLLPRDRALDLATGSGRNAAFLAANGWRVVGVDASRVALESAAALASERGIPVQRISAQAIPRPPKAPGVLLVEADLEGAVLPASQFDLVVCCQYLQRSLFDAMERTLRPGGVLIFETYTLDQLRSGRGPVNPDHLLRPGELLTLFPRLESLFYREYSAGQGIAGLVAKRPSARSAKLSL